MSTAALELIAAFDALPDAERDAVAVELLARSPVGVGEWPGDALVGLADEVFLMLDAAEADDAAAAR